MSSLHKMHDVKVITSNHVQCDTSSCSTEDCAGMQGAFDSLLYHMEKKYLCDQHVESFIDIFGTSPCKVANEKGLELLVLDRRNISNIGDVERFSSFVRNVTELDLAWNNIKNWSMVATLLSSMPSLKLLNLSHNPLDPTAFSPCNLMDFGHHETVPDSHDSFRQRAARRRNSTGELDDNSRDSCSSTPQSSTSCEEIRQQTFLRECIPICQKLSTLILNGVRLPLLTIQQFVSLLPSLRELHLAENHFDFSESASLNITANDISPFSTSVKLLNLNACELNDWNTVLLFIKLFPNTSYLFLADSKLESIESECYGLRTEQILRTIRSLTLSGNYITTWQSIENLSHMRRLEELRIRNIPLLNNYTDEERRHLIVGRLRSLTCLNGSTITPSQREESERFFIRFYQNSNERPWIYDELVSEHGHLEQLVKVDLTPRRFAKVMLRCEETNYSTSVRIRLSCTVLELMKHAEKVTGISIQRMRVFYFDVNVSVLGPTELRFPNQKLKSLHIEDGDEFFIQSKIQPNKLHQQRINS